VSVTVDQPGLVRMSFELDSVMTIGGSALWCWVLAWFGGALLSDQPNLIQNPSLPVQLMRDRSWLIGGFALSLCALYVLVTRLTPAENRYKREHQLDSSRTGREASRAARFIAPLDPDPPSRQ
jgi:hypothetical protein